MISLETQTVSAGCTVGLAHRLFLESWPPCPRNCRLCVGDVLLLSGDIVLAEDIGRLVCLQAF